jgi:hypothetical protein
LAALPPGRERRKEDMAIALPHKMCPHSVRTERCFAVCVMADIEADALYWNRCEVAKELGESRPQRRCACRLDAWEKRQRRLAGEAS